MTLKKMKARLTKVQNEMAVLELYFKPAYAKTPLKALRKQEQELKEKISKF